MKVKLTLYSLLFLLFAPSLCGQKVDVAELASTQARIDGSAVPKLAAALAAAYANNEAKRQFDATPFSGSASAAVLRLNRWKWQATVGFGKGDLRATVSFREDGSDPKVELQTLVNEVE